MYSIPIMFKYKIRIMQKFFLTVAIICFSVALSAQDLQNEILISVNGNRTNAWYKGQTRDKKPHGMGVRKSKDGMLYVGDFSNREINGYGMMLGNKILNCNECVIYVGNWKSGKKNGVGTCYSENGDVLYSGKFENDKPIEPYPSVNSSTQKRFSLNKYTNSDKYWGEEKDGLFNGFGVYVWESGDLWFGNFKDGTRDGIGLYLDGNAEWATLNCKNDDCVQVASSLGRKERDEYNKAVRADVRKQNLELIAQGVSTIATGISQIQELKSSNSGGYSGEESVASRKTNSSGGTTKNSSQSKQVADCGPAWMTDSRTYGDYDTQLAKMQTYPERYDDYPAKVADIQSRMRQIRKKWETRGCVITKSPRE